MRRGFFATGVITALTPCRDEAKLEATETGTPEAGAEDVVPTDEPTGVATAVVAADTGALTGVKTCTDNKCWTLEHQTGNHPIRNFIHSPGTLQSIKKKKGRKLQELQLVSSKAPLEQQSWAHSLQPKHLIAVAAAAKPKSLHHWNWALQQDEAAAVARLVSEDPAGPAGLAADLAVAVPTTEEVEGA